MNNKIRAKMRVQSVKLTSDAGIVVLVPVHEGPSTAEDSTYTKAAPAGALKLKIDNPAACDGIKPEQTFYVDLTPVE